MVGYNLAINGTCVQRRFTGAAVVMPLCPCVQAEFRALCKVSFHLKSCDASCTAGVWMVPVHDGLDPLSGGSCVLEHEKGIRWMPWHQEAMKDVARCEKPRGAASRR